MPKFKDEGTQTILSNFYKEDNIVNPDLKISADLLEFGTGINIFPDSKELIDKAVQTKPDMHIDLS
jgi:hypothetical protein